jgi:hypothetical protein
MTFRPYTGKVRLGDSDIFLDISDFSQPEYDGYVLSRSGETIVATLIGQSKLALSEPQNPSDAATKAYVDSVVASVDPAGDVGQIQFNLDNDNMGASPNFAWNDSTSTLSVSGKVSVSGEFVIAESVNLPAGQSGAGKLAAKDNGALYFVDSDGYSHYVMPDGLVTLSGLSPVVDFSPELPSFRTINLSGTTAFSASNYGSGRAVSVRMVAGASTRAISFPNGWKWLGGGSGPTSVPANKVAMVSVVSYGSDESDVVAGWSYTDSAVITGNATTGQIAFFNGDRNISGETNLQWDAANDRLLIGSVASPAASLHVAGTVQVDGTASFTQSPSMGGNRVTDVASPSADTDAVNKSYVESRRLYSIQMVTADASIEADKDLVFVGGAGSSVLRLPLATVSNAGKAITIKKTNTGEADLVGTQIGSGQSVDGTQVDGTSVYYNIFLQNETVTLVSDGSNWFVI